jgi:modulator of FtsH protease
VSNLGKWLSMGAIVLMLAIVANIFLKLPAMMMMISALSVLLFSAFILYDLKRIIDGGETNYVTATLAIYLDVYNVFQSLLSLLGIFGGSDD